MAHLVRTDSLRALPRVMGVMGLLAWAACGGSSASPRPTGAGTGTGGSVQGAGGATTGIGGGLGLDVEGGTGDASVSNGDCEGLACQQTTCTQGKCTQMACAAGTSTTVSGIVYDPAGKVPLYNIVVYVPNREVKPFTPGVSCDRCGFTVDNPVASALTDTHGKFVLKDVPVGADIPVVIQIGKWRRQFKIANVPACVETALGDKEQTRLPRNKTEGDIPLIAIVTGGADSIECLPRRMGIEDSEFTTDKGTGRIHLYAGMTDGSDKPAPNFDSTLNAGAALTSATSLWATVDSLKKYDVVILSCEGGTAEKLKPTDVRQAMYDYASIGGRVLATHWQHIWYSGGPAPVPTVGTWKDRKDPPETGVVGTINTSFPKGQALADWLVNVGSMDGPGKVNLADARDNIQAVNDAIAKSWITIQNASEPTAPTAMEYVTFNTPIGVADDKQCGRAVFTDLHVGAASSDKSAAAFPAGCKVRDLSTQEKVVEFMLFDLSSCIQNDQKAPEPPAIVK